MTFLYDFTKDYPVGVAHGGLTKPGKVGDFFALVSMKSPNFCQKAKF
jgi:hypothetical protein